MDSMVEIDDFIEAPELCEVCMVGGLMCRWTLLSGWMNDKNASPGLQHPESSVSCLCAGCYGIVFFKGAIDAQTC